MNMKTEEILLRTSLQDCREKYDKLRAELAAAQAVIEQMREALVHEARALECERLAKKRRLLGDSSTALLLDIEAAAHRGRKEGK